MSDDVEQGGGCCGCLTAIIVLMALIGGVGLAWRFMLWCWQ